MKIRFGDGPRKTTHPIKTSQSCFDEIKACAGVFLRVISFRVVFARQ